MQTPSSTSRRLADSYLERLLDLMAAGRGSEHSRTWAGWLQQLQRAELDRLRYGTGVIRVPTSIARTLDAVYRGVYGDSPNPSRNPNCVIGAPGCNCRETGIEIERGVRERRRGETTTGRMRSGDSPYASITRTTRPNYASWASVISPEPLPLPQDDSFASRMLSYSYSPVAMWNATFTIPDDIINQWPDFLKVWRQLGVAHKAACFMKEVHYSNGEITNEAQLTAE